MLLASAFAIPAAAKWISGSLLAGASGVVIYEVMKSGNERIIQDVFAACDLCNRKKDGTKEPWRIVKTRKTVQGRQVALRFPYGKTYQQVIAKADAINTALGVDVAYGREGNLLIMDIPTHPLPTYLSFSDKMMEMTRGTWQFVVGQSAEGWILHDFNERPMLLIAGLTRGGKTEVIRNLIATIFLGHDSDDYELLGVDMKPQALEFRQFRGLWKQLASTPGEFLSLLYEVAADMTRRAKILAGAGCTNVKQYERLTGEKFMRRFVIVDEYGKSFGSKEERDITTMMMQVSAMGAGLGVHIVLCTQRPDAEVVDGKIRANMGCVICMQVATEIQSRVILGRKGAEDLPEIPGRAIYQAFGRDWTVQTPFVSKKRMDRILPVTERVTPVVISDGPDALGTVRYEFD